DGNLLDAHHALVAVHPGAHALGERAGVRTPGRSGDSAAHSAIAPRSLFMASGIMSSGVMAERNESRKRVRFEAAFRLLTPNRMSPGIFEGRSRRHFSSGSGFSFPSVVRQAPKSSGKSSPLPSLMARIATTGIFLPNANSRMIRLDSMS